MEIGQYLRYIRHAALIIAIGGALLVAFSRILLLAQTQTSDPMPNSPQTHSSESGLQTNSIKTSIPEDDGMLQRRDIVLGNSQSSSSDIKSRRNELTKHIVQEGETVWGIALEFGLRPETILWSNYKTLRDNPDLLNIGRELMIPPEDGLLIDVEPGDTVDAIARRFKVKPESIIGSPLNGIRGANDQLPIGKLLFVPGGERELVIWQLPEPVQVGTQQVLTQRGLVKAKVYRVGVCGNVAIAALGTGALVYPTGSNFRSGFNFSSNHGGIDFGDKLGNPIYAADSGTVVFAGDATNAYGQFVGYGRYVVLDHGNGYQTLYAHNTSLTVSCGQQVTKGETIAYMGSTGKSTGPHSHFELWLNGTGVNPWSFLP